MSVGDAISADWICGADGSTVMIHRVDGISENETSPAIYTSTSSTWEHIHIHTYNHTYICTYAI